MKKLILVKWRAMPMMITELRKEVLCGECKEKLGKKATAFRPMLDGSINGVQRYHRICLPCAERVGTDKKYN